METARLFDYVMAVMNTNWSVVRCFDGTWLAAEPAQLASNELLDRYFDSYEDAIRYAIEQACKGHPRG